MPQVRARVTPANRTETRFVQRSIVLRPLGIFDVQLAARGKCLAGSPVTRRQNAVEHVDPAGHGLDEVFGRADAHQVSRTLFRHFWPNLVDYLKHSRLLFANTEPADRVTVEANLHGLFETLPPQIHVTRALNDAKQRLHAADSFRVDASHVSTSRLKLLECCFRSPRPTRSQLHAALRVFVSSIAGRALVKGHHEDRKSVV